MMLHSSKLYLPIERKRVFFTDNLYTRSRLAQKMQNVSDEEIFMKGTCKFSNIDGINRPILKECVSLLKGEDRGSWILLIALQSVCELI